MKNLFHLTLFTIILCGCASSNTKQTHDSQPATYECPPAFLLFEVTGYDGYGYKITLNDRKILFFKNHESPQNLQQEPISVTASNENWIELKKCIQKAKANHWKKVYEPSKETHDGVSWKLIIIFYSQNSSLDVVSFGHNAYPENFSTMVDALSSLLKTHIDDTSKSSASPFQSASTSP